MGDQDDRKEFIKSVLTVLTKSTIFGEELTMLLYENGLIGDEEMQFLRRDSTTNITKATTFYTTTVHKWNRSQFKQFLKTLETTGNSAALQIFTNAGADVFLTNDEVQLFKQQKEKKIEEGCYERQSLKDEEAANKVVQLARRYKEMFKPDGKFKLCGNMDRREIIPLVRQFSINLKNETIWWNSNKPPLPLYYIERLVARTSQFNMNGYLLPNVQPRLLIQNSKEKLVLLADSPGMGKSSELSHLEKELRISIPDNRVIIRVNLSEVQKNLATISSNDNVTNVIGKLAACPDGRAISDGPSFSLNSLKVPEVRVFVLLDGLDEVCPMHQETMIKLLRILTPPIGTELQRKHHIRNAKILDNLHVVVTIRPHLREALESAFHLESWSLLPLTKIEQDYFMKLGVVFNTKLEKVRNELPSSMDTLLSNPLMLLMLVNVLNSGMNFCRTDHVNIYSLYSSFLESTLKIFLVEKTGMRVYDSSTEERMKGMLESNLPHYYRIAIKELIDEDRTTCIINMCGQTVAKKTPSETLMTEMLSVGLVIKSRDNNQPVFKHRSFAEFFYARLLTEEEDLPQEARNSLFALIYGGSDVMQNVETYVEASLVKIRLLSKTTNPDLSITTGWIFFNDKNYNKTYELLNRFMDRCHLIPHIAKKVLPGTFTVGQSEELLKSFEALLHGKCQNSSTNFFEWMSNNKKWTRNDLLKIHTSCGTATGRRYSLPVARLIIAAAVQCVPDLLSLEEVGVAVHSCDHDTRTYIVSSTKNANWDSVSRHLKEIQDNLHINVNRTSRHSETEILLGSCGSPKSKTIWVRRVFKWLGKKLSWLCCFGGADADED